jgi:peptide deformylase
MPIRTILQYPNPLLKVPCSPVGTIEPEIRHLITDLVDTMLDGPGSVGVAAPQVGCTIRLCVVDVSRSKLGRDNNHGLLVLINPAIVSAEGGGIMREGCMSIPDYTGDVERPTQIALAYTDENGEFREISAQGFEAVAIQHELDHLDGILFLDRISSVKTGLFRRKNYR